MQIRVSRRGYIRRRRAHTRIRRMVMGTGILHFRSGRLVRFASLLFLLHSRHFISNLVMWFISFQKKFYANMMQASRLSKLLQVTRMCHPATRHHLRRHPLRISRSHRKMGSCVRACIGIGRQLCLHNRFVIVIVTG